MTSEQILLRMGFTQRVLRRKLGLGTLYNVGNPGNTEAGYFVLVLGVIL